MVYIYHSIITSIFVRSRARALSADQSEGPQLW